MIVGIVQARSSSRRLPGKVLMPILDRPMLERQLERLVRSDRVDQWVVATSDQQDDDLIVELCDGIETRIGAEVAVYRGPLADVLERFAGAARAQRATHAVRLTGDCPLADPAIIDGVIACHLAGDYDYSSNVHPRSFPQGLDVEVIRMSSLEVAAENATLPSEREHVTPHFYQNPEQFRMGNLADDAQRGDWSWSVDESRDLEFVRAVYAALYPSKPAFGWRDVVRCIETDAHVARLHLRSDEDEGWARSMAEDEAFLKQQRDSQ